MSALLALVLLALLTGCQAGDLTPQPPPPSTTAGATSPPTVTPTWTRAFSSPAPTLTSRPQVTSTPHQSPTTAATATSTASATATIQGLIGPVTFPDGVNPLTGERVADPSLLARRPLAIKVSNYPPIVRPQSGLNSADLVFEHYAESGVTRFTAVFYSRDAAPVGSIRSGRLIDLEIPKMYDAAFAYSGASGPVRELMRASPFFGRIISPDFGHGGFFRVEDPDKAFEHTLFTDTWRLRAILDERGANTPPQFSDGMAFLEAAPVGGTPARSIELRYTGSNVYWSYNAANRRYFRSNDGAPHVDANSGQQLSFRNVIVLGAHHENTLIVEDAAGNYSIEIQIWGEGPASIFRDGQRYEGRWRRAAENDMLSFYYLDGAILPLAPGNSFLQVVPLGFAGMVVEEN